MALGLDGKEKPGFVEGQRVKFHEPGGPSGTGRIRGLASEGLIDFWIIERDNTNIDNSVYPYSCFTLPHTTIEAY